MNPTRTLPLLLALALAGALVAACGSSKKAPGPTDPNPPPPCRQVSDCPAFPCATASCSGGACAYAAIAADTACDDGQGGRVCDGLGSCVACNTNAHCEAAANVCTLTTECVAHACNSSFFSGFAPPEKQTPNDCLKILCDPSAPDGLVLNFAPEDVVTTTSNPCSVLTCVREDPLSATTTFEQPLLGTPCPGGVCDPAGVCSTVP